MRAEEERGKK